MDDDGSQRLILLAIAIIGAPFILLLVILALASFGKGDWQFGVALLAILPLGLLTWVLGRHYGIRNAHRLEGRARRNAEFRNWALETFPWVLCFGLIAVSLDMTISEALVAYARTVALMLIVAVAGWFGMRWICDRWSDWRNVRRKL